MLATRKSIHKKTWVLTQPDPHVPIGAIENPPTHPLIMQKN